MRGKKGDKHLNPDDPPRCRANKRRGRGTYANDRPPIVGTVGRQSGQVRLRVVKDTTGKTLEAHVHQFTQLGSMLYTDENQSYNHVIRPRATVCHGDNEWARDDDGDGIREVHVGGCQNISASFQRRSQTVLIWLCRSRRIQTKLETHFT